jgi:hypothetical protein
MSIGSVSGVQPMMRDGQSEAADRFAARQVGTMQEIIQGRNAAQRSFVDSRPDTHQAFESMINSLYAQGSSHASEAARLAATVQEMRAAAKAYMENNGAPQISPK